MKKRLKILIWHVHGSYLYYLTQAPHDFYLPSKEDRKGDYIGRFGHIPWGDNVHDVPYDQVKNLDLDCIIFQLPHQYLSEQYFILSDQQRQLPKIYLEHDPPQGHPTDTKHIIQDPNIKVVHVTAFNRLMWDNGPAPTRFIDHGVIIPPGVRYTGEKDKGIVVINNLKTRARKLGLDIYTQALKEVPLELVGMGAQEVEGGTQEVIHKNLCAYEAHYRFFFNPIRYTSFPLSVIEAMMVGLPIVALATTEVATAIHNGVNGYADTRPEVLIARMKGLIKNPKEAQELGANARTYAMERFGIERFIDDWNKTLQFALGLTDYSKMQTQTIGR